MNGLPQNAIARTARVSKHSVQNVLVATRGGGEWLLDKPDT